MKWEYKEIEEGDYSLDKMGMDGWELCTIVGGSYPRICYFKRPVREVDALNPDVGCQCAGCRAANARAALTVTGDT